MKTILYASVNDILLIQLYWFSLLFIGYISIHVGLSIIKNKKLITTWNNIPGFAKLSLTFTSACVLFTIYTILGYVLKLSPAWLAISYFGTLLATMSIATIYLIKHRTVPRDVILAAKAFKNIRLFSLTTILVVAVVSVFIVGLVIGSYINGDTLVHLSKIRHLMTGGFTFTDMYFGTVPETRYTISLLHTLIAIPSYLGIDHVTSWIYSMAALKLFAWSAIYYLAWRLFSLMGYKSKQRMLYTNFVSIIAVSSMLLGPVAFTYPNHMVIIWIILFVIGLIDLFVISNPYLIVAASALITFTHPLDAIAIGILVAMVMIGVLAFSIKSLNIKTISTIIISGLVLIIMPVMAYFQPSQMSQEAFDYGLNDFNLTTVFNEKIFIPDISVITGTSGYPVFWAILSAIGFIYIILQIRGRVAKIVVSALALYVPLVLYNPFSLDILTKVLPYWSLARFTVVNILTLVSVGMGVIGVLSLLTWLIKKYEFRSQWTLALLAIVAVSIIHKPFGPDDRWILFTQKSPAKQIEAHKGQLKRFDTIKKTLSYATDNSVVLATKGNSFIIPAISPHYVVSVFAGNATPAADITKRLPCAKEMLYSRDRSLMKQAGVDYVLISNKEKRLKRFKKHPDQFHLVKRIDNLYLFSVNYSNVKTSNSKLCDFNE